MKFSVDYASDPAMLNHKEETVEIASLNDLKQFAQKKGYSVLIDFNQMNIMIVDDYID